MMLVKRLFCLALAIFFTFSLASCSRSDQEKNETLVIYDGQFAETRIIHRMVKLLVEKHTNAKVDIRNEMAPPSSFHELVKGSADIMNSYDGTVLTTFLHLDPSHVPAGMSLYDYTNQEASKRHGVHLLGKMGTNNTYAVAVPHDIAKNTIWKPSAILLAWHPNLFLLPSMIFSQRKVLQNLTHLSNFIG